MDASQASEDIEVAIATPPTPTPTLAAAVATAPVQIPVPVLASGRRPPRSSRAKCRAYCRIFMAHLFSHIGLCTLVVGYAVIGAFAFEALEAANEIVAREEIQRRREACVQDMWAITLGLNVLYDVNWTALMRQRLRHFEDEVLEVTSSSLSDPSTVASSTLSSSSSASASAAAAASAQGGDGMATSDNEHQWSFSGALLYSVTVITTIGYGNIAPKTPFGKVVTIVYALFGIPLMLLCLTNIGDLLAHGFKFGYTRMCGVMCRDDGVDGSLNRRRNNSTRLGSRPFRDGSIKYAATATAMTTATGATAITVQPPPPLQSLAIGTNKRPLDKSPVESSKDFKPVTIGHQSEEGSKATLSIPVESDQTEPMMIRFDESSSMTAGGGGSGSNSHHSTSSARVPITMVLAFVSGYICIGAAIFSAWEGWTFLNGAYFCFITLSTIGFGDLVPGTSILDTRSDSGQAKLIICCVYLILGLAIIAMSFNLVQEEVTAKCKQIGRNLGILASNDSDSECDN